MPAGTVSVLVFGVGVVLTAAVGGTWWSSRHPYEVPVAERDALEALGLRAVPTGFEGPMAGCPTTWNVRGLGIDVEVTGLSEEVVIRSMAPSARFEGPQVATRARREALAELHRLVQESHLSASYGHLKLFVPKLACQLGRLVPVAEALRELLEVVQAPEDWAAVALDGQELFELRLQALRAVRPTSPCDEVAKGLAEGRDAVLRKVGSSLLGEPALLEAYCDEAEHRDVHAVLEFLPPGRRGAVVGRRMLEVLWRAHPFAEHLEERLASGEVPSEELRALAEEILRHLDEERRADDRETLRALEGVFKPMAWATKELADRGEREGVRERMAMCVALLRAASGAHADALVDALVASGTEAELDLLREARQHGHVARHIRQLEARNDHLRGGLAIAPGAGGELAVVDEASDRGSP